MRIFIYEFSRIFEFMHLEIVLFTRRYIEQTSDH